MDPDRDLTLQRTIRAPRERVWQAWTDPDLFARWFFPAPVQLRVDRHEVRPGGAMATSYTEDGITFVSQMSGCFLVVEEFQRLVFTTALDADLRPAEADTLRITAEITLADHPDGTDYRALVRHAVPADRAHHEELGFVEGWGLATAGLAKLVEPATV